ncbi:MAG: SIMPL domain-containing protein [Chloroflexi bacterium]|nr:SIMPL domain-containing protein [Chloroflexota bacterium]
MRGKGFALAAVTVAALALLAVACGGGGPGGGGEEAGIRTNRGLAVAALEADQNVTRGGSAAKDEGQAGQAGQVALPPGAPAAPGFYSAVREIAPDFFPYPALQVSQTGITVQGFGSATVQADRAILEVYLGSNATRIEPAGGGTEPGVAPSEPEADSAGQVKQITEADVQPVVDAIVASGVAREDVEVIISPYYDPYSSSATIRATVRNLGNLDAVVKAATDAANNLTGISLQGTNVSYTIADCAALERAAMEAAVQDAGERATRFAQVLGVTLGAVVGASNSSYAPFGGSPCDSGVTGPYPLGGIAYAEGQSPDVQLVANVVITYGI